MTKLIFYNLKFGKNKQLLMALIVLLATLAIRILSMSELMVNNEDHYVWSLWSVSFIPLVLAAGISSLLVILSGLYRSIFGKQGYLMQTLPVSKHRLVQSQYIVALIWFNLMLLVIVISIGILTTNPYMSSITEELTWIDFATVISIFFMCNVFVLFFIATVFMGMTISNCSFYSIKVHPIFATVITFIYFTLLGKIYRFLTLINFPILYLVKTTKGLHITTEHEYRKWNDTLGMTDLTIVVIAIALILGAYIVSVRLLEKHTEL